MFSRTSSRLDRPVGFASKVPTDEQTLEVINQFQIQSAFQTIAMITYHSHVLVFKVEVNWEDIIPRYIIHFYVMQPLSPLDGLRSRYYLMTTIRSCPLFPQQRRLQGRQLLQGQWLSCQDLFLEWCTSGALGYSRRLFSTPCQPPSGDSCRSYVGVSSYRLRSGILSDQIMLRESKILNGSSN